MLLAQKKTTRPTSAAQKREAAAAFAGRKAKEKLCLIEGLGRKARLRLRYMQRQETQQRRLTDNIPSLRTGQKRAHYDQPLLLLGIWGAEAGGGGECGGNKSWKW